jgi:hypothetical protein
MMNYQRYHYYSLVLFFLSVLVIISLFLVNQVMAKPKAQYVPPNEIEVKMFALDPDGRIRPDLTLSEAECRNNNPITKNAYGCGNATTAYPYPTNSMVVNLEDGYLPYVVAQELGSGTLQALKAQAVASCSYALHVVEFSSLTNSVSHQVFTPYSITPNSQHQQAVNETRGMIMICDNDTDCEPERKGFPIFAEFSAGHSGNFTEAWPYNHITKHLYLASIWDPIHTAGGGHGRGMSHEGAMLWAIGLIDGNNYYPIWGFEPILGHYFRAVKFQNVPNIRNGYRSNVIQISNLPDGYTFTNVNRRKEDIVLILQNTGLLDWYIGQEGEDSCKSGTYDVALSYHIYDGNNQIACGDPNAPSGNPCFEGVRTLMCLPDRSAPLPPGHPPFIIEGVTVQMPVELPLNKCYTLRWDIELLSPPHDKTTWISHLQQTPWQAQ